VGANTGLVRGVSPGSIQIMAEFPSLVEYAGNLCSYGGLTPCPVGNPGGASNGSVPATPTISGPDTVWWFNGASPSTYTTSIKLTAQPAGGSYQWQIVSGSNEIAISNATAQSATITGTGLSDTEGDQSVTVAVNGVTSSPFAITVRGPYMLVKATPYANTTNNANSGWSTTLSYVISDNLGEILPWPVPFNEQWTSSLSYGSGYNAQNCTWPQASAGGSSTTSQLPSDLYDSIAPPAITTNPKPTPQGAGSSTNLVIYWGQEFQVGSSTPGQGAPVQTDTIQYYIDHAAHTGITSPVL